MNDLLNYSGMLPSDYCSLAPLAGTCMLQPNTNIYTFNNIVCNEVNAGNLGQCDLAIAVESNACRQAVLRWHCSQFCATCDQDLFDAKPHPELCQEIVEVCGEEVLDLCNIACDSALTLPTVEINTGNTPPNSTPTITLLLSSESLDNGEGTIQRSTNIHST